MNYQKIYNSVCSQSDREGYTEVHHIIPRCVGGTDESVNLVRLTARKHFIAHQLLAKLYPKSKLVHAAHMMSNMKQYTSKIYSWLREAHVRRISIELTGRPIERTAKRLEAWASEERNAAIGASHRGRKKSPEHIRKFVLATKGKVISYEHRRRNSEKLSGLGNPMYGKTHGPEALKKMRESNSKKVVCPHCSKLGGVAIMQRWHFNNCKTRESSYAQ